MVLVVVAMAVRAGAFDGHKLVLAGCRCFDVEAPRHVSIGFGSRRRCALLCTHFGGGDSDLRWFLFGIIDGTDACETWRMSQ